MAKSEGKLMLNVYVLKKYALLFMSSILPTVTFLMVIMMGQSGLYAGIYAVVIAILMIFVTSWALKNPFTNMLEGKGTLAVTLDSAGLLRFFNVAVVPPFVSGKLDGKEIEDIYDRAAVFNMMPPSKSGGTCYETKDKLFIKLEKNDYEKGRMQVMHYPLFIYNKFIDSIVTKEFISDQEQAVFGKLSTSETDIQCAITSIRTVIDQTLSSIPWRRLDP